MTTLPRRDASGDNKVASSTALERRSQVKADVVASLVVFLVALPLSLGIAVASGAPVLAGLIAAAVGGIVAGSIGGAPLQVSGPAAGLTVIVFATIHEFGWPLMCLVTVAAGLIQVGLGASRIARAALAISPAVVHGMLAGIGATIALAQIQVVLGGAPASRAVANLAALPGAISAANLSAAAIGLAALGLLGIWPRLPAKLQAIPAPLVAVVVPTLAAVILRLPVKHLDLPANLLSGFSLPAVPALERSGPLLIAAATLAIVASVESLLSAVATDKMHRGPRADLDRELVAQGVANTVSGLIGGVPVTGVIVRGAANVRSGARTRLSAILHGIWIIVFAALFGSALRAIPLSALAGLLVFVGVRLIDVGHIRELARHHELPVYVVTFFGVVALNLLEGVALGVGLAIVLLLRRMVTTSVVISRSDDVTTVAIDGSLTFLAVPKLARALNSIGPRERVAVELHADFMDHAAFDTLHAWERGHLAGGGQVVIAEHHEDWYATAADDRPRREKLMVRR